MTLAAIVQLLQTALLLITLAQGPNVPSALKTQAVSVANQAIAAATQALAQQGSVRTTSSGGTKTVTPSTPVVNTPVSVAAPSYVRLYHSTNLIGHAVSAECNPGGGTNCACDTGDVRIQSYADYGSVVSNTSSRNTWANAIGHKKFIETYPSGQTVQNGIYKYRVETRLPRVPVTDATQQELPEAVHVMIQLWDGRNALWSANKRTLEAVIYWDINPWSSDFGKIKVYSGTVPSLIDTGIRVTPDTEWHTFEIAADFNAQRYTTVTIDGVNKDLSHVGLASVAQPTWGNEVAMVVTTESEAAWPQAMCSAVTRWTQDFRNAEFFRFQ